MEGISQTMDKIRMTNHVKQRNSTFELLRIISMLLIIAFHYVFHSSFIHSAPFCINKVLAYAIGSWGIMGVHCFFFISAWFLQRKAVKFNVMKLYTIVFQLLFYAILVLTIGRLTGILVINLTAITDSLFFWYITAYCIMYLLSPFLNNYIDSCDKKTLGKLLILLTLIFPVQLFVFPIFTTPLTQMSDTGLVIYDYLLIGYLKKSDTNFFERNRYKGAFMSIALVILAEVFIAYFINNLELIYRFTSRYSIFQLLPAVFVFYIFKNLTFQSATINTLAKATLAIYIIHEGVLSEYLRNQLFQFETAFKESYYILCLLAAVIFTYFSVTLIDYFRNLFYTQMVTDLPSCINKLNSKINQWFTI